MVDELQELYHDDDVYHGEFVQDTGAMFSINAVTRAISVSPRSEVTLSQFDHNSERFTFRCPRYIDSHDMSKCNKVEVHYINIGIGGLNKHKDLYEVLDLRVDPDDDGFVLCSWLVSQNATSLAGTLNFIVHYACMDGENVEYSWHTGIFKGVKIGEGINNTAEIIDQYVDILEQWKLDLINTGTISVKNINAARDQALGKIDAAHDAVLSDINKGKSELEVQKNDAINRVNNAATTTIDNANAAALSDISKAKETAKSQIETSKNTAVNTINNTHNEALGDIEQAKESAVSEVLAASTHIDEDGTWVVGGKDTNVPATGKSAYQHAQDGGYKGTEQAFAQKMAGVVDYTGVHIGPDEPTGGEDIWIDTDATSAEEEGGEDTPSAGQPDYAANEGEKGYIKNRTHYVDKHGVVHKLDNKFIDAEWMATKEEGGAGKTVFIPGQTVKNSVWSDLQGALVVGNKYAVDVKGILYECVCRSYDGTLYVGNGLLMDEGVSVQSNEPFCIAWMGGTTTGGMFYSDGTLEAPIGIEVRDWQDTIHNQLPEEYLPDCAVKGNKEGVLSWSKLSDKPFVAGAGELFFSHTATFASDAAAKNGVPVSGASVTAILNTVYWLEVNGELFKCHWERAGFSSVLYDENGNEWASYGLAGVYVMAPTAGTYTYKLYAPSDELMLEPQYIPPNIARKHDIDVLESLLNDKIDARLKELGLIEEATT